MWSALAQTIEFKNPLCLNIPANDCTIMAILKKISVYFMLVGAPLAAIMILWGAFIILTAGGNSEKVKSGIHAVVYAAVGYGIILISWGIISLVKQLLGA